MVAFKIGSDAYNSIIRTTKYTDSYIQSLANDAIREITKNENGFLDSLNPLLKETASNMYGQYKDFYVADSVLLNK
jgi:hypothetical protein